MKIFPRPRLRAFTRADVVLYHGWMTDPAVLGDHVEAETRSLDELLAEYEVTGFAGPEEWHYLYETAEGEPMGYAHWWRCDRFEPHLEFGRVLLPIFRDRGLGLPFLLDIIDKVYATRDNHRLQAITACGNERVVKQWEQAGIQREGRLRSFMRLKDEMVDCYIGSILREDWLAAAGRAQE